MLLFLHILIGIKYISSGIQWRFLYFLNVNPVLHAREVHKLSYLPKMTFHRLELTFPIGDKLHNCLHENFRNKWFSSINVMCCWKMSCSMLGYQTHLHFTLRQSIHPPWFFILCFRLSKSCQCNVVTSSTKQIKQMIGKLLTWLFVSWRMSQQLISWSSHFSTYYFRFMENYIFMSVLLLYLLLSWLYLIFWI